MSDKPAILGNTPVFESLVPLVRPTLPQYGDATAQEVAEIFQSGILTKGKHLRSLEQRLAEYLGVKHAVVVSSCTLGLCLAYHGLGLSGEVIVPSFTFMATVHPLVWVGAKPVFVDINPRTWNIEPARVEGAITDRTTGIVAVHNFGNPAEVDRLEAIASQRGIKLIFDAAHGFGSSYRGKPVGGRGDVEVFSLSPTKLLVAGEGGVVATNDDVLADHIILGREYGNPGDYGSNFAGLNARMPELSAVVCLRSLDLLEVNAASRNRAVDVFRRRLESVPGITFQEIHPEDRCSYKDLSILIDPVTFGLTRDELATALKVENVDTRKYHDPPVHTHKAYSSYYELYKNGLAHTDDIARSSLSLPIWSHMDFGTASGICAAIERAHNYAESVRAVLSKASARLTTAG